MMKRWKTRRKKYDDVKRKIVVHSRTFRSAQAKEFTSVLGLADNESDSKSDEESEQSDEAEFEWGKGQGQGIARTHTRDLVDAGQQEAERRGLLEK
mmetsp:Transcript_19214/g.17057  ORF Transcript_19214/g.17057 Transcript_19214/m.17057 type:complete len:96 (-) Transcript_19214:38-325(-)